MTKSCCYQRSWVTAIPKQPGSQLVGGAGVGRHPHLFQGPGFCHMVCLLSMLHWESVRIYPHSHSHDRINIHHSSPTKTLFYSKYPGGFKQVHSMQEIYPYPSVLVRPVNLRTMGYSFHPYNPQFWGTEGSELQNSPPSEQLDTGPEHDIQTATCIQGPPRTIACQTTLPPQRLLYCRSSHLRRKERVLSEEPFPAVARNSGSQDLFCSLTESGVQSQGTN